MRSTAPILRSTIRVEPGIVLLAIYGICASRIGTEVNRVCGIAFDILRRANLTLQGQKIFLSSRGEEYLEGILNTGMLAVGH